MPMFFYPKTSDGVMRDDPVGTEHHDKAAAIKEGFTYVREMALERLRCGDDNFEESVVVRDSDGLVLGHKQVVVKSTQSN